MIRHDFHAKYGVAVFSLLFQNQRFQPFINAVGQHRPAVFWAKDNVILTRVDGTIALIMSRKEIPVSQNRMLDVNLKGTFLAIKACLPPMKTQQYGKIVVISSTSGGRVGLAGAANYGASKAGKLGFVLCACLELAPYHITINAILPGCVAAEDFLRGWQGERLATLTREIPMQRLAEPLEVAYGALFFASDESRYITGQSLVIDGGMIVPELPSQLSA